MWFLYGVCFVFSSLFFLCKVCEINRLHVLYFFFFSSSQLAWAHIDSSDSVRFQLATSSCCTAVSKTICRELKKIKKKSKLPFAYFSTNLIKWKDQSDNLLEYYCTTEIFLTCIHFIPRNGRWGYKRLYFCSRDSVQNKEIRPSCTIAQHWSPPRAERTYWFRLHNVATVIQHSSDGDQLQLKV